MKKVYELYDIYGNVVYVGESINPEERFRLHVKVPKHQRNGRFHGQQLTLHVVAEGLTPSEALKLEEELKEEYGFTLGECRPRKLTKQQRKEIKELYKTNKYKQQELADMYNVSRPLIGLVVTNKR